MAVVVDAVGMSVAEVLELRGGVVTRAELLAAVSRADLDAALEAGDLIFLARGRYASPQADRARAAAHRITGTVCLLSAALLHGWAVKTPPTSPQVAVAKSRKLTPAQRKGVDVRRLVLADDDVVEGVTSTDRTLLDCARWLAFDDALAVVDSALRDGFPSRRLAALARDARGPRARQIRRLAAVATDAAANPFESVLRAIALDVSGLSVRPQVPIWADEFLGRPDLVDTDLRIALEADSFEWHGGRDALASDARRYNRLVVRGWLVLRFAWEDVMFDPGYVREILRAAVDERTPSAPGASRSA